jgi:hypothetical protein
VQKDDSRDLPYYEYADFLRACKVKNVIIERRPKRDARRLFNLYTDLAILEFITHEEGLKNPEFQNKKELETNTNPSNPIWVDAYEFRTVSKRGYLAFYQSHDKSCWIIKSLHESTSANLTIEYAFRKARALKEK